METLEQGPKLCPTLIWDLPDAAATERLGQELGRCVAELPAEPPYPALLLEGPLGAGKTSLVRALCLALPGSEAARPASPSFTLVNRYPTRPELIHADLYRLEQGGRVPEELVEAFEEQVLTAVEWADRLPEDAAPTDRLRIRLSPLQAGRRAEIAAHGPKAERILALLPTTI